MTDALTPIVCLSLVMISLLALLWIHGRLIAAQQGLIDEYRKLDQARVKHIAALELRIAAQGRLIVVYEAMREEKRPQPGVLVDFCGGVVQ